jgi:hypothetical protein
MHLRLALNFLHFLPHFRCILCFTPCATPGIALNVMQIMFNTHLPCKWDLPHQTCINSQIKIFGWTDYWGLNRWCTNEFVNHHDLYILPKPSQLLDLGWILILLRTPSIFTRSLCFFCFEQKISFSKMLDN